MTVEIKCDLCDWMPGYGEFRSGVVKMLKESDLAVECETSGQKVDREALMEKMKNGIFSIK